MTRNVWQGASWECWAWHNVCGSSSKQQWQQRHQPRSFRPCRCQLSDKRLEATGPHQQPHSTHISCHTHTHTCVCPRLSVAPPHAAHATSRFIFAGLRCCNKVLAICCPFWTMVQSAGGSPAPSSHSPLPQTHRRTHTQVQTHTQSHITRSILAKAQERKFN